MKWILFLCCLGTLAAAAPSTLPSPALPTEPERYLFLVETSEGMRRLDQASRQALFDLIYWGADGHMEGGDTYGLWTFNEEVQSGIFPMQMFDPELQLPLATRASLFLKDQPYESKTDMGRLVLKLLSVVISVKDVNIFIVTDSAQPIVGLRFDNEIKVACESRSREARRAKKPFIVCLAARGGDIHSWSVSLPGEQVPLPARRPVAPPQPKPITASAITSNTAPRATAPSIMMTSTRPRPSAAPEQKQPVRAIVPSLTPDQMVNPSETNVQIAPALATQTLAPPRPLAIDLEATAQREAALVAAAVAEAEILRRVSSQQHTQKLAQSAIPAPSAATPPLSPHAQEITVSAREPGIVPGAGLPGATRLPAPLLSGRELVIAGMLLLLIAGGLVLVLFRWSHPGAHGSYITRSMDR